MPTPKNVFVFTIAILLVSLVSSCGPAQSGPAEAEIAVAVALTQTAGALAAQPPTAEPSPAPEPTPTPEPTIEEAPDAESQESEFVRVEFPAGATETKLVGRLTPGSIDHYVLRAEAEQNLVLSVYPPGVVAVAVIGADGTVLKSDLENSTEWSGTLPLSQEYYIDVTSIITIESEYTLDISIPPLEPVATTGEVSGVIGYPDAAIPQLHVVGYNLDRNLWYYLLTGANNTFYLLPGLPPGKYHIAAYAKDGLNGFYMSGGAMAIVIVDAGETTEGIDLTQWFAAGSGPYPNDPVGW